MVPHQQSGGVLWVWEVNPFIEEGLKLGSRCFFRVVCASHDHYSHVFIEERLFVSNDRLLNSPWIIGSFLLLPTLFLASLLLFRRKYKLAFINVNYSWLVLLSYAEARCHQ